MLPLKLVRSLVMGETIPFSNSLLLNPQNYFNNRTDDDDNGNVVSKSMNKTPWIFFIPTKELVRDTYRLATLARDIGMDLYPNPSLSHIIFSWPSSSETAQSPSCSLSSTSLSASTTSSSSWSLPDDAVPIPFPSLNTASLSHLRLFASLTKGFFKLVFSKSKRNSNSVEKKMSFLSNNHWDCSSLSLISRNTGGRIDSMDCFSRALLGTGWTLYKTKNNSKSPFGDCKDRPVVYLFRKVDLNRIHCKQRQPSGNGNENGNSNNSYSNGRVRELRLPQLDFRNAPLRILQYILLMTDDIFYLA